LIVPALSQVFASGRELAIQPLPAGLCHVDNLSVYAPRHKGDGERDDNCVLYFTHPNYEHGPQEGNEILLRLNGLNVHLHTSRQTVRFPMSHYEFANKSANLKATMDVKANCPEGVEGCDHSGLLTVKSPMGESVVHVIYYWGA
jgi:hypothetical protein